MLQQAPNKEGLLDLVRQTSNALAADRTTKYLPAVVAVISFIILLGVALIRTRAAIHTPSFNTAVFISVEVHGIAFTSLYFWIVPVVLIASFIGVSQTESRIPRIPERFHNDLDTYSIDHEQQSRVEELRDLINDIDGDFNHHSSDSDHRRKVEELQRLMNDLNAINPASDSQHRSNVQRRRSLVTKIHDRTYQGGIYSWQPSNWQYEQIINATHSESQPLFEEVIGERRRRAFSMIEHWLRGQILPLVKVLIPIFPGAMTSGSVLPTG